MQALLQIILADMCVPNTLKSRASLNIYVEHVNLLLRC